MKAKKTVVYLSPDAAAAAQFQQLYADELAVLHIESAAEMVALCEQPNGFVEVILNAAPLSSSLGISLLQLIRTYEIVACPIYWLSDIELAADVRAGLGAAGVTEILPLHPAKEELLGHLFFLNRPAAPAIDEVYSFRKTPGKRIFDVVCATAALVALSPLLLVVAALVRLESKGPVFYYSYRVGTGYKVFKFWKFRSMRPDADQLLASMKSLNQYALVPVAVAAAPASAAGLCAACVAAGTACQTKLVDTDGELICEKQYWLDKKSKAEAAFVKIANDPRITRIGRFLRNTSIDELPQLYNVLRGDMAIVGNRPLPLYEAEKLMTDQFAARFIAPAGITGLWQVTKRGKGGEMSEDERKALDNEYARQYSLRKDLEIILRTVPVLFQKENV